ncbi:hypothetical protein [Actinoplanes sp. NPDC051851]|uniref:hypothetical protein n=1 Tax=Actinoplanes sp. NPDC051851 TaxID=3154753 RepID=UPI00341E301B
MTTSDEDPVWRIAVQVADCFSQGGYAFVEDDMIDSLAATLRTFLERAGISTSDDVTDLRE